MTDTEAKANFSANVRRLLAGQGHSIYWLMVATGDTINRTYSAVNGRTAATAGLLMRVASALEVSVEDLLAEPPKTGKKKSHRKRGKVA